MAERSRYGDADAQPLEVEPKARVLVAGATGFAGALAARIVWRHPELELAAITARSEVGTRLDAIYPRHRVPMRLLEPELEAVGEIDAAIVAYPHGAAAPLVADLRERGAVVVDLSADFRLRDLDTYERWYGEHGAPELLPGAVYGLTELNRDAIRGAKLVANPGCYPTASLLALAPAAEAGLIDDVVIDAKSGVSGAGRGGGEALHFSNVDGNLTPYGLDGHRHLPEIEQELGTAVSFIPHLLPLDQGLMASCYFRPRHEIDAAELRSIYEARYSAEPFIELSDVAPGLADVLETNFCRIHTMVDERNGRAIVFAAIDNLWKGAASQAVQNLNLMLGLDEREGIA